jgi:fructose-1,6-bisphosphatase/inositol monophosphatase family enzyme
MTDPRTTLKPDTIERLHAHALTLADEARRIVLALLASGFEVVRKPDGSYVTSADFRVEERLRALIEAAFPDHGIAGEEYAPRFPDADFQWVMDPIDGTEDFVHRVPTFGCIIGLFYRGHPLVGVLEHPALATRVHGAYGRGTWHNDSRVRLADIDPATPNNELRVILSARENFSRHQDHGHRFDALARRFENHRIYRSCYAHTLAVIGAADAMVDYGNRIWDIAAAQILAEEAGGKFVPLQDLELPKAGRLLSSVFGKPGAVERLVTLLEQSPLP